MRLKQMCMRHRKQHFRRDTHSRRRAGFTLIELTLVLVLLGILAVVAIPRLDTRGFDDYAYAEELRSALRYARQVAVARNATIAVPITGNSFRVCSPADCSAYLTNPGNGRPWNGSATHQGMAPAGVALTLATGASPLVFNSLGGLEPNGDVEIRIGAQIIRVVQDTGHVH